MGPLWGDADGTQHVRVCVCGAGLYIEAAHMLLWMRAERRRLSLHPRVAQSACYAACILRWQMLLRGANTSTCPS